MTTGREPMVTTVAEAIARRVLEGPPRLGPVRLVCVDGPAGSGKTTLAAAVARRTGAAVLHLDDLYEGWAGLGGVWDRLEEQVLVPLAEGRPARYQRYDWVAGRFAEWHDVPVPGVLVLEGCGSAPRAVDGRAGLIVWVEAPADVRLERGLTRDGAYMRPQWDRWMESEAAHFAREDTRARADVVVDGTGGTPDGAAERGPSVPDRSWLRRPVLTVAPDLLGTVVRTTSPDGVVAVRLTEVEAYAGLADPGSHAFRGPTARNRVMFGPPGHLYVYRHLGLHHCANVVTGEDGVAAAVLLRAGEVVEGHELARDRRRRAGVLRADVDLARGPARLAVALGLDLSRYGVNVLDPDGPVVLLVPPSGRPPSSVRSGPRVGVSGAGGSAEHHPWRYWLDGEPTVSAYRPGTSRRASAASRTGSAAPEPQARAAGPRKPDADGAARTAH